MKKYGSCKCQLALLLMFAATGLFAAERPPVETDSRQNGIGAVIDNMSTLKKSGKLTNTNRKMPPWQPLLRKSMLILPVTRKMLSGWRSLWRKSSSSLSRRSVRSSAV